MADKITAQATFRAQRNLINEMVDYKVDLDDTIGSGGRLLITQAPINPNFDETLEATVDGAGKITCVIGDTGSQTYYVPTPAIANITEIATVDDGASPVVPAVGQTLYLQIDNNPESKIPGTLYIRNQYGPSGNLKTINGQRSLIRSTTDGLYYTLKFIFDGTDWVLISPASGGPGYNNNPIRFGGGSPTQFTLPAGGGAKTLNLVLQHDNTYFEVGTSDAGTYNIIDLIGDYTHMREIYLHIKNDNITMTHSVNFQQPEGVDILTKAGDVLKYIYDTPNWKCVGTSRAISSNPLRALYSNFTLIDNLAGAGDDWALQAHTGGTEVYLDSPIAKIADELGWTLPVGYYAKHWLSGYIRSSAVPGRDGVFGLFDDAGTQPFVPSMTKSMQDGGGGSNPYYFTIETPPLPIGANNDHKWYFKEFQQDGDVEIKIDYMGVEVLGYGG